MSELIALAKTACMVVGAVSIVCTAGLILAAVFVQNPFEGKDDRWEHE